MLCVVCGTETHVIDSRQVRLTIRRRRHCLNKECGHRFTTYETQSENFVMPAQLMEHLNSATKQLNEMKILVERSGA